MPYRVRTWQDVASRKSYAPEIEALAQILAAEAKVGDIKYRTCTDTVFDLKLAMSIDDLLIRCVKYLDHPLSVYLGAAMHLGSSKSHVRSGNVMGLFLGALICTAKFLDDTVYSCAVYAQVADVPDECVKAIESSFLYAVDWKLWIRPTMLERFHLGVTDWAVQNVPLRRIPQPPGKRSGSMGRGSESSVSRTVLPAFRAPRPPSMSSVSFSRSGTSTGRNSYCRSLGRSPAASDAFTPPWTQYALASPPYSLPGA
eukprot:TRINITY_DN331_c0_g1_i1.p1 TRINITY_DN331_c0_g1~~TRINITY_DN331_c0_g1_i1.p1  ORF type:complete len:288 (+),score=37.46 TRINITY_DN331_c0_g1_i1:97-864(+)